MAERNTGESGGSGGYGNDQNAQNRQTQRRSERRDDGHEPAQSRGERYDELSGGGRGADSVSFDPQRDGDDFEQDQREHQDRGRGAADEEIPPS